MKKLLSLISIVCYLTASSQNKIGNITVDAPTFTKYLLDCYNHPDTLRERSMYDYSGMGSSHVTQIAVYKQMAINYNTELKSNAIKMVDDCCPATYAVPRKPSESDFIKWLKKKK